MPLQTPCLQVTTLRRNGSDYSATIVGALFRASHITIWTDVDGVYSADPRQVRAVQPLLGCDAWADWATCCTRQLLSCVRACRCCQHTAPATA